MAHTHLHEFLREDQEPFHLKNYIADRRSQLKFTETTTAAAVTKRKPQPSKNVGFGLLGSFLKRLKYKSTRTRRHEINSLNNRKSSLPTKKVRGKEAANDVVVSLDADWSENWSESETSCSSISSYEIQSLGLEPEIHVSSSSSPFRFSLYKSPSLGHRTPDFRSPATSRSHRFRQDKENYDNELSKKINGEDMEQCSPVSVLDPPFKDDEHEYNVVEGEGYEIERGYATLQRTKHQLMQKLLRFERLVELDPIALEKPMAEEYDNDEDDDYEGVVAGIEKEVTTHEEFLRGIIDHLSVEKIPLHVEKLVLDLISGENKKEERESMVKRVCWRLDSWKRVESNTIDMMVEFELRREKSEGWKRHDNEIAKEIVTSIEVAITGVLVEEFTQELVDSCPNLVGK